LVFSQKTKTGLPDWTGGGGWILETDIRPGNGKFSFATTSLPPCNFYWRAFFRIVRIVIFNWGGAFVRESFCPKLVLYVLQIVENRSEEFDNSTLT
jgi:hypothetical protein